MNRYEVTFWAWLLMAAMALCSISCSDDDMPKEGDDEPQLSEEELAELAAVDRYEAANYVIRAFAGLDELPDNWESTTFAPTEGVVVDEAKPGVRYVIVENQAEADQYFLNITPDETREETANGYQLVVNGFGSLSYQRTATATCYGVVKCGLMQMPTLQEIRLVPESEVPTNAKYDGNPYYGFGSLVREKGTQRLYICVRPSGGPNRKEYAYFVSFDPKAISTVTKKMNLYEIDEKGKKTKTLATTAGNWTFAKNLVEKRIAIAAAVAMRHLAINWEERPEEGTNPWVEISWAYKDNGLHIPESYHYFVPYGSYKSSSAGSNRQAKYEQPGLCWTLARTLGLDARIGDYAAVSFVCQRPDAKSHLLTLTDDYDPSYYYNWSKAVDPEDIIRWDGKTIGYQKCFNILDYALNGENTKCFYPGISYLKDWGDSGSCIPVLLMTQKKITDKGQASSKFVDVKIIDQSREQYDNALASIRYYEVTDGRITSYDRDDEKLMKDNPDM